jgi:hypothetical protein
MHDDPEDSVEVAVVMPAYNSARFLPRAIESIFAQTCQSFRIFVIDDGSTDETDIVMRNYSDRVTYIQQTHAGAAAARNRGIAVSKSRFVAFLDADDIWLPNKLEQQLDLLHCHPSVGLACSGFLLNDRIYTARVSHVSPNESCFEQLLHDCFISTPTVIVRRECLNEVGSFHELLKVSEDYNLWLRIASQWPVAAIPEVLVHCNTTSEGLSSTTGLEERMQYGIDALEHVQSSCTELNDREQRALRKIIVSRYYAVGSYHLERSNRVAARHALARAWSGDALGRKAAIKLLISTLPTAGLKFAIRLWRSCFPRK